MKSDRASSTKPCFLCGRTSEELGAKLEDAHMLANRLTGKERRWGGAKNVLREEEWVALEDALGQELQAECGCDIGGVRHILRSHADRLCNECHQEVLSEPVFLPSVMRVLREHFQGATRAQKILVLTKLMKLGAEALAREAPRPPSEVGE